MATSDVSKLTNQELTANAEKYLTLATKPAATEAGIRMATNAFDKNAGELVARIRQGS